METERKKQFESASSASSAFAYPSEEDFTKWMQGEGWLFIYDEDTYPEFDSDYLYSLDEVKEEFENYANDTDNKYRKEACKEVVKSIDKMTAGKISMGELEEILWEYHMFTAHSLESYCDSPEMDEIIEHRDKCRHHKKSYTNIVKVGYYSQL